MFKQYIESHNVQVIEEDNRNVACYVPSTRRIHVDRRDPHKDFTLAHEFGHHKIITSIGGIVRYYGLKKYIFILHMIFLIFIGYHGIFGWLSLLCGWWKVFEEATASIIGLREMRKYYAYIEQEEWRSGTKSLLKAWMTYMLAPHHAILPLVILMQYISLKGTHKISYSLIGVVIVVSIMIEWKNRKEKHHNIMSKI